ncbi:hypothetical protein Glove_122g114 [Diversispora epigaea]|uniref:Uncharacterized protein n=1 Tax=Diversispora epigaea TaxID=1348612 RepID=A0A397J7V6_9GLOM|nr:hypothetical protein Glove_122g114 [Diversispora epigaea]
MSTSITLNHSSLVKNWDTETFIIFLRELNLNLDENDIKILRKQKIDGQIFPDMTEKKFMKDGMKQRPAIKLEKQAKIFKEQTRVLKKGKIEYFWLFPCGIWSIRHFISWSINMFGPIERNEAHTVFYNTLHIFRDDPKTSQEILEVVRNLLLKKKVNRKKVRKPLADISNQQEEVIERPVPSKSDSLVLSAPVAKKRSIDKVLDISVDIPLRNDRSIDILEILKIAVHDFDQGIIALGSSRSYKSSNYLYVNFEHYIKVSRESTYDAEMYRVLKPDSPHLEALLELLATVSISKLNEHFEQVFKYTEQLRPQEIWIVYFSREDFVVTNPYWPCEKLQERELNVIHFWHDKKFKNVRMSARFQDVTGKFCEIIDAPILS